MSSAAEMAWDCVSHLTQGEGHDAIVPFRLVPRVLTELRRLGVGLRVSGWVGSKRRGRRRREMNWIRVQVGATFLGESGWTRGCFTNHIFFRLPSASPSLLRSPYAQRP